MNMNDERDETVRLETAADWMVRLQEKSLPEEEVLHWVQWCEADPLNQRAFDQVQQFWKGSIVIANHVEHGELRTRARVPAWHWRRNRTALAAAFAAAISLGVGWFLYGARNASVHNEYIVATNGELVHATTLIDGSEVQVATKSAVAVHYSRDLRALELQSGEAYFSVAPNRNRPFVVTAGAVTARAVGTAFTVRQADDRIVVTVTKGVVDVDRAAIGGSANGDKLRISAGNRLSWSAGSEPTLAPVDAEEALAWREGRLEYLEEPLGAVIADVNRYSSRQVIINSEAAKTLRFSGTVLTSATEDWLRALPSALPVVLKEQDGVYLIEQRAPARR
jgi:transmembrane sensor